MSLFVQDDWRKSNTLTFNLGLRYELLWPFIEAQRTDGQPRRDARLHRGRAGACRAAAARSPEPSRAALLDRDTNNLAPRVGVAWRFKPGTILRGGYGISYNAGAYSTIARQLVGQPPFAVTNTAIGTSAEALSLNDPLVDRGRRRD